MARPNALVDGISSLSSPRETLEARPGEIPSRSVTVNFQGGRSGRLDMAMPRSAVWADVLDSLRQTNEPVYVEIDPETNVITELLLPREVRVGAITPTDTGDAVEVELIISQARHYLRRTNPDFQQLFNILQTAQEEGIPVLVTETLDGYEIIDVKSLPKRPLERVEAPPPVSRAPAPTPVTLQKAQEIFNLLKAQTCNPTSAPPPCIPFLYPDDGCWGRAHEMCRLMLANGVQPEKVWIYAGSVLRAATQNNPSCEVRWGWHVAPTLLVSTGGSPEIYVIDPSLFLTPVRQTIWFDVQGDPSATLVPSDASVFYRSRSGSVEYDPNYTQTQQVLTTYRNQLKLRSASSVGPPPYNSCVWKVKAIAARCLSKNPPISVKRDIYVSVSPQARTLRQQLAVILSRC
ncbi:MAG TPA: hypothetical protein DCY88_00840 [Cyanobacteria bacterium UBA11372]|nr:hypothetical protein [Cyanobacteria bacterium UBA11372]